jgi:glycosyltransferase involved in cell wall biosynthesis
LKSLIIIPTLNEKKNIHRIASKIFSLKKLFLHILFVDDNSNDGSQAEILKLAKKKNVNYLLKLRDYGSSKMKFYHVLESFIKLLNLSLKNINQKNYNK